MDDIKEWTCRELAANGCTEEEVTLKLGTLNGQEFKLGHNDFIVAVRLATMRALNKLEPAIIKLLLEQVAVGFGGGPSNRDKGHIPFDRNVILGRLNSTLPENQPPPNFAAVPKMFGQYENIGHPIFEDESQSLSESTNLANHQAAINEVDPILDDIRKRTKKSKKITQ